MIGTTYDIDSKIAFFQSEVSEALVFIYKPPTLNLSEDITKTASQNVKMIINFFLGSGATNLGLKDFFTKPYTKEKSNVLTLVLLVGLVIALGLIAFMIIKKKVGQNEELAAEGNFISQDTKREENKEVTISNTLNNDDSKNSL